MEWLTVTNPIQSQLPYAMGRHILYWEINGVLRLKAGCFVNYAAHLLFVVGVWEVEAAGWNTRSHPEPIQLRLSSCSWPGNWSRSAIFQDIPTREMFFQELEVEFTNIQSLRKETSAHPLQKYFFGKSDRPVDPPFPICHICNWHGFELISPSLLLFLPSISILSRWVARSGKNIKKKKDENNKPLEWALGVYIAPPPPPSSSVCFQSVKWF